MPATLITGANRGLGLEFARQYLADGGSMRPVVTQHPLLNCTVSLMSITTH
jgi:NAD(P)-dependent dehydrogenase (short-subunit alcohol dehydrogenase family)